MIKTEYKKLKDYEFENQKEALAAIREELKSEKDQENSELNQQGGEGL